MKKTKYALAALIILPIVTACNNSADNQHDGTERTRPSWSVTQKGNVLEIAYGQGSDFPQYAALHLDSSYFRMNTGPGSGWGTSVILFPSFWKNGYHQGGAVTITSRDEGTDLALAFQGTVSGLGVQGTIRIMPPVNGTITANVQVSTLNDLVLDNRPGEAFKPVMLSSMHINGTTWDAQTAFAGNQSYAIPAEGWIINPPQTSTTFGLRGGTSAWKAYAPTIEITMDQALQVTGWVSSSTDPSDDNVGFWAASDRVLPSWTYTITAKQ